MGFLQPQVTDCQKWVCVETNAGDWWIPLDVIPMSEWSEPDQLLKYTEGTRIMPCQYPRGIMTILGYGVRRSAPGYTDATDWEVFTSKRAALKRYREMIREDRDEE